MFQNQMERNGQSKVDFLLLQLPELVKDFTWELQNEFSMSLNSLKESGNDWRIVASRLQFSPIISRLEQKQNPTVELLRECTGTTSKELLEILVDVKRTDVIDDILKFVSKSGTLLGPKQPTQESIAGDSSFSSQLSWPLQDSGHESLCTVMESDISNKLKMSAGPQKSEEKCEDILSDESEKVWLSIPGDHDTKMTQDSIRAFVRENFGRDYFPVYHGQSNIVTPLALVVKRNRKWWKRPFGKAEMIVLADLENYVTSAKKKLFHNACEAKIKRENKRLEKTEVTEVSSNVEVSVEGCDFGGMELKLGDVLGDLELGKLTEEYYQDPDLRDILSAASLDHDKMAPLEDHHLLLVTGVMYSTKFVLRGNRIHEKTVSGNVHAPSEVASWFEKNVWFKGRMKNRIVPPSMVHRNSRAPFLFKFCRVDYDRENKRLKIHDGDYVGKRLRSHEKEPDYEEAALNLEMEASFTQDSHILTEELDYEKIQNVIQLLITEEYRAQRKSIVLMYLQRFEQILAEETKKTLSLDKPLTSSDSVFLNKLGIRARPRQMLLRVHSAPKSIIQEYGILFKLLCELSEDKWQEFETMID